MLSKFNCFCIGNRGRQSEEELRRLAAVTREKGAFAILNRLREHFSSPRQEAAPGSAAVPLEEPDAEQPPSNSSQV